MMFHNVVRDKNTKYGRKVLYKFTIFLSYLSNILCSRFFCYNWVAVIIRSYFSIRLAKYKLIQCLRSLNNFQLKLQSFIVPVFTTAATAYPLMT